jgi:hypothetical protein
MTVVTWFAWALLHLVLLWSATTKSQADDEVADPAAALREDTEPAEPSYLDADAVLIAVSSYSSDLLDLTESAWSDIKVMQRALLRVGYSPHRIYIFSNDERSKAEARLDENVILTDRITRDDIESRINKLRSRDATGRSVLLYLSGHGVVDGEERYFGGSNADLTLTTTFAPLSEIAFLLESRLPMSKKLLVVDACANRSTFRGTQIGRGARPAGVEILLSAQLGQKSRIVDDQQFERVSLFSRTLADALEQSADADGDRMISTKEALDDISKRMTRYWRSKLLGFASCTDRDFVREDAQCPALDGDGSAALGREAESADTQEADQSRCSEREGLGTSFTDYVDNQQRCRTEQENN